MGVLLVIVSVVILVMGILAVMMFFRDQQRNSGGSIHGVLAQQKILHKFFKSRTGYHDHISRFRCFYLTHIQRIVMQTGYFFSDQSGHS